MANRAKHAFGKLENLDAAISEKLVDSYDILFMKDKNDKAVIGWIDAQGNPVIVTDEKADLTELEADVAELETVVSTKANAEEVNAEISALASEVATKVGSKEVANAVVEAKAYVETEVGEALEEVDASYEKVKFKISDVPVGTLIDYRNGEIRVMSPSNTVWTKQAVGNGGNQNAYYMTFKTICTYDNAVGYMEHINGQSDTTILTDLKVDQYGRRYQPTWLSMAIYDATTDTWTYRGAESTKEKYVGWSYRIDWYDANGVMVGSDSVRINLSNESCHSVIEPYYANDVLNNAKAYVDEQIAKSSSSIEVIEF